MEINYQNNLAIDITPGGTSPTWARLGAGLINLTEALNEVLVQASYLINEGWGSSVVTGGQMTLALTGHRLHGDPAQDYIFSDGVKLGFGSARETTLRLTRPSGAIIEWVVVIANATEAFGDANQPNAITINLHGNGKPTILSGGLLEQLKVVSVAGSTSGNTAVYVNPALDSGNSYKYKTAAVVSMPAYDEVLTTGWATWNGTAQIAAVSDNELVIAEVETATNKARKAGVAIVTALA